MAVKNLVLTSETGQRVYPVAGLLNEIDIHFPNVVNPFTARSARYPKDVTLASHVDWREVHGVITSVSNQRGCVSSYAIAVASAVTMRTRIKAKAKLPRASYEEIVSCLEGDNNRGCSGGSAADALKWVMNNSLKSVADCPPSALRWCKHGACKWPGSSTLSKITVPDCLAYQGCEGSYNIKHPFTPTSKNGLMHQLSQYGPTVCMFLVTADFCKGKWLETNNIFVYSKGETYYGNGEYEDGKDGNTIVGCHACSVVGYGEEKVSGFREKLSYWILQNSWGENWGAHGYAKVAASGKYTYKGTKVDVNTDLGFDTRIRLKNPNIRKPCCGQICFTPVLDRRFTKMFGKPLPIAKMPNLPQALAFDALSCDRREERDRRRISDSDSDQESEPANPGTDDSNGDASQPDIETDSGSDAYQPEDNSVPDPITKKINHAGVIAWAVILCLAVLILSALVVIRMWSFRSPPEPTPVYHVTPSPSSNM